MYQFRLKGAIGEGKCYETPYKSLVGLDWIQQNDGMAYHLERMVAHVSAKEVCFKMAWAHA
ncbi:hypothetical protein ANCCAN_23648 [Ancylostoma caninum]|uniref:Uncharacterized protein n=1 Tax=Ancylostoma caninum TaxID=29170 RepID=A0A368FI64_ANCCA|nr:hypothetical protein ANCCAN_23648 [Ancylostoma caninum]